MYRFLFSLVVVLFASLYSAFAAPLKDGLAGTLDEKIHTGRGTWFHVGLGNCGLWNIDTNPMVAIAKGLYDSNDGGYCNQWVEINYNGRTVHAMVRDSCQSCGYGDLDMSPGTFEDLAALAVGEIDISWHFMDKSWRP